MSPRNDKRIGLPPGSVFYTGDMNVERIEVEYAQYDSTSLSTECYDNKEKIIFHQSPADRVDWYDIRGIHDTNLIEQIGSKFDIHPLILEDVSDVNQRPKFEEYDKGVFIIAKALWFTREKFQITTEQVAIYFNEGTVLSFQETESDLFKEIRKRLSASKGRIRQRGADYLAYALLDVIVDNYFSVLDDLEIELESLEDRILANQNSEGKADIHLLKTRLLGMRKAISPFREAVSRFSKSDSEFIEENTLVFIRDLYDHTISVMDMVESFRDLINSLQDLFISEISFKMNQVMQVLTIVASIFIPMTFLAGIYGMNFENIPELGFKYGYFVFWIVMVLIFIGSIIYFRRKKWL